MSLLSIVVAVYNEEANIRPLYERISKALKSFEYEIIFVDDGSSDGTLKELLSIEDDRVRVIELSRNFGQSSALFAGFDEAKGEYIITMDGDLQNDPEDIPQMVAELEKGDYDLVTGIRQNRQDNFVLRKIPSWLANRLISRVSEVKIRDNGCALKVFRRETAKSVPLYGESHRLISVLAALNGARIHQVPVRHHPRIHGESKYGLSRTIKVIADLILLMFQKRYQQRPMHFFGGWGILIAGAGMLINIYLLVLKILGEDIWGKPLLLLGILLILVGLQMVTIGIIADTMMRTYYESQNKRPFTVRKVYTGGKNVKS